MKASHYKVVIIGSGCAGYTAAIYAARANLAPIVFEGLQSGGQLTITTEVENYPGFSEGIQGPELMEQFKKQAARFGTEIISENVTQVDFSKKPFQVTTTSGDTVTADAIVAATGASAQWLGIESEKKLTGHGVSACATCDAFFFKQKEVVVIGGGDTAMEEATFLTKFASKVIVVHRRNELRASKIMQEKAKKNDKISFVWDSVVEEILSDEKGSSVVGIRLKNVKTQEISTVDCQGVFIAIGHKPNTDIFKGHLNLDEAGYITVQSGTTQTSVPGVFACGDAVDHRYRQAITAAGTGCMAAIDAERYLEA
jgi:thioredoxin reductase (NADPH)